uniref:Uncharacterized protein n=1 Tax=Oryza sativa subsp. japonica TaxID=39947 RepID=Q6H634_ORYSJ|nr:hypothetical protein [Oryza sativa Japonica Group]BAD25815.1 hypothetical protein [Oryza sativa Japonica Group]
MATAARGVEAVAAAARRAEAARLSATAATGVEAVAAAPDPSLSDLAEGERGTNRSKLFSQADLLHACENVVGPSGKTLFLVV